MSLSCLPPISDISRAITGWGSILLSHFSAWSALIVVSAFTVILIGRYHRPRCRPNHCSPCHCCWRHCCPCSCRHNCCSWCLRRHSVLLQLRLPISIILSNVATDICWRPHEMINEQFSCIAAPKHNKLYLIPPFLSDFSLPFNISITIAKLFMLCPNSYQTMIPTSNADQSYPSFQDANISTSFNA